LYFGEDYYDEDDDNDSDLTEIVNDPYAEADRIGRLHSKERLKKQFSLSHTPEPDSHSLNLQSTF
jgi:hypothetical protein